MKYIVLWFAIVAALGLLLLVAIGMMALVQLVTRQPELAWVPAIIIGAMLIATLAVAFDWWTDHREPKDE